MSEMTERLREGAHVLLKKASGLQERIRQRAHAIWEREGRPHGRDRDHWHEAEKEIATEEASATERRSAGGKPKKAKIKAEPAAARAIRNRATKSAPLADAATAAEVADSSKPVKRRSPARSPGATATAGKPRQAVPKKGS